MVNQNTKRDTCTITGVFATREDAENAFHSLMELGYSPDEITLIMSDETKDKLYNQQIGLMLDTVPDSSRGNACITILDALDSLGKFVAIPGVSLMVAGDFNDGGVRALTSSVMSDRYAQFYQNRIKDGEIVIDFQPHTIKERNMITSLWENYGGDSVIRRLSHAA